MNHATISFDGVWKKFRRGERHDSLRDLLPSLVRRAAGRARGAGLEEDEFWAVRDVSFQVARGEALGIIGQNGAGKSTVLKLLNRILKPTRGNCHVTGRVGALIEVAAGFHPDLTGRENVFLQGAIMGMTRRDIAARLDAIVEFAGVEKFIDTQVKRYSSGMNARLGFSIAAHLEPESLIIDEVLSVGDMAFQEKCVRRMKEFKRQGAAIAFVSHNLPAVADLCDRVLVLSSGSQAFLGAPSDAIEYYLEMNHGAGTGDGTDAAIVRAAGLRDRSTGAAAQVVTPGAPLTFFAVVQFKAGVRDVSFGVVVHDGASGVKVAAANSQSLDVPARDFEAGDEIRIEFPLVANLANGQYLIEFHAATAASGVMHVYAMPAATLRVEEGVSPFGVAFLNFGRPSISSASVVGATAQR